MKKIPTVEEFLEKHNKGKGYLMLDRKEFTDSMIEFAKLHVQAALKAAAENAKVIMIPNCNDHTPYWGACVSCGSISNPEVATELIDEDSILNAYSLDKIK